MKSLNLNHSILRAMLLVLLTTLGITNAWGGGSSYYTAFTATSSDTGKGLVYASGPGTSTAPANDDAYEASKGIGQSDDTGGSSKTNTYYAWAKAARGYAFDGWTITGSNNGVSPTSSATQSGVAVTVTSNVSDGSNIGTATAGWIDATPVTVTYGVPVDGSYTMTYSYTVVKDGKFATEDMLYSMSESSAAASGQITSYAGDNVTVSTDASNFEGWYNNADFTGTALSTNSSYSFQVSGATSIYAKFKPATKYYGKVAASIPALPNSMPGGGTIYISNISGTAGATFSEESQEAKMTTYNSDVTPPASMSQTFYLHAKPTDKRYTFRGWFDDEAGTGTALSTDEDWEYTFAVSSHTEASPTTKTVYAIFDFKLYYMQVEIEPAIPGLGMVLASETKLTNPEYGLFSSESSVFTYALRAGASGTNDVYVYAKPKYGYKLAGWYSDPECTIAASIASDGKYTATGSSIYPMDPTIIKLYAKFVVDDAKVNITYNIPDQTKGEYTASVLDIAEVDDEFVWTFTEVYNSADYTTNTTLSQNKTDVLQLEAQPQAGYGVTSWTEGSTTKTTPSYIYETAGTAAKTLSVTFGEARPFLVGAANATTGTAYSTLREALDNIGNNKKITVVQNAYVPAGTYTIPSGVTLLVPYSEDYAVNTEPSVVTKGTPSRSVYVTLTLGDGAIINVSGSVCANAVMCLTMGYNGSAMGKYGLIDMNTGSQMNFKNSSNCYAWGYVIGEGQITAESGATIHETFQFKHRGGTAMSSIAGTFGTESHKVFPINQYYIQSIESPILIKKGASEKVYTGVHNVAEAVSIDFIGTSGLFQLTGTNAYLIKQYDVNLDRQKYTLYGNATISSISFGMSGFNKESKDYVLPITNNMTLDIELGTTTIQYETALLPDVQVIIGSEAKVVASGNCYVYDSLNWKGAYAYACQYSAADQTTAQIAPVVYRHGGLKYDRKKHKLRDVTIDVQGEMSGNIYTTTGGANIMSSGSGKVTFSASRSATTTFQVGQDGSTPTWDAYSLTSAQLHNGDGSYVQTSDATDADQFIYSKVQERWLKNPKVISWDANGGESEASTLAYSEGDFLGELPAAYKDGYTLEGWFTEADGGSQIAATTKVTANATYYAHWTPKTYTISYRDQGGAAFTGTHIDTPTPHPTTHTFGIATPLNGVENNKTGYTYGGWYRTPSCSGTVVTTIAAGECRNITLYAKWAPNIHNLTWDANGGMLSGDYTSGEVAYGTTIVVPSVDRENYVFTGWSATPASTMPDNDLTYTAQWAPAVASVTANNVTTNYATIQEAFTAANGKTGATVKLLKDITITSEIALTAAMTIDLNGKTISSNQAAAAGVLKINASGKTVTIKDSGTGGKIDHTANYSGGYMYGINLTAGTLNITSGTIYAKNTANNRAYGIFANGSTATITMSNGTVEAESSNSPFGLYANAIISLTMTGGTFIANGDGSRGIYTKGTTTLTNATITSSGANSHAIFAKSGNLTINSGTYTATGTGTGYAIYFEAGTVTVNGGKFNGISADIGKRYTDYSVALKGGYYVHRTDLDAKCATNYHVFDLTGEDLYKYEVAEAYTITFNNYDGTQLQSGLVEKGTMPEYLGETPTKPGDEDYTYTFIGWDPEIVAATADATYTAQFSQVEKEVGTKLDIVEWTSNGNGKDSLTLNLNGIPAAGWPYTINNVVYYKDKATATAEGSTNYRAADRTLTIPYSGSADTKLIITVKDKDNNTYSRYKYIIPHVYGETAELAKTNSPARVIVVNSGTLTITYTEDTVRVNAIYVAPGAELKVNTDVKLKVDSLMLRTTPWEAAILDNQGTISSSKTYYTRKIADNTKYYQFAIPLASDVKNVRLSNNSKCTYNTSWMLKSYDEESRAKNGAVNTKEQSNWKLLEPDGEGQATILGSVGYEMFSNTPYYREYYFPVELPETEATEVGVSYHSGEAGPNHAGWNALCSPLMGKYSQTSRDPSERLKISLLNPDGTYQQTAPGIIYPAVPFYYQASDNGKIYFNGDAMVFNAPRRAWNAYVPTQWMQLAISNLKGDKLDETSIYAHPEKFAPEYETGYDVAKQSLTGGKALIYSELPCGKLAFAAVPDSLAENRIPITVNANDEGEFLFSLMENNYLGRLQHVLLHDMQNGFVTDLLERDYSAKLNAGTNAGRFYIQCVFAAEAPAVTTGVNSVESNDDAPQKIMYKNKVYIIYQGRVYDMTGRQCELK